MHIHVGEARMVGEMDMQALRGDDMLLTTLTYWRLVNLVSKFIQLTTRMDSMTLHIVSILMKGDDG
jgi:hypothetical protein